ncbi:hypothetical protein C8Q77DRAFT_1152774 [Trametes polyzona]|nr:hypothetical protein C8Q77DRAFT_1152774 [Trametes polyzona]
MAAFDPQNNPKLDVVFTSAKYTFLQSVGLFPPAEVMILGDAEPRTFQGAPLVLAYNGAHCVYHGFLKHRGGPDAAKFRPIEVAVKWVAGRERIDRLVNEAEIYETRLNSVRGVAVPKYYGFYTGTVESMPVACMILEWCSGPPIDDVKELNRQRMLAATKMHQAGVMHGHLLDPRHFLPMRDGTLRIVDFSTARAHKCPGARPLTLSTSGDPRPPESCGELDVVESRFGVDAERHGRHLRWANGFYPELVSSFYYKY